MKYLKVFVDFRYDLEPLTDEERGRLFTAMLRYAEDGTEPDLTGNERFLWPCAKRHIDAQADAYQQQCDRNRKNGASRYESLRVATTGYESQQEKEKEKEKDYLSKGRAAIQYRNSELEKLEVKLTQ